MLGNQQSIEYGRTTIHFNLSYTQRKTLEIAVYPDQTVWVTAPESSGIDAIYDKVRKRGRWIVKQISYFSRFDNENLEYEYISGETHRYLGKQYRLKVIQIEDHEVEDVKLKGGYFVIHTRMKQDVKHVKKLLEEWYRIKAEQKFNIRLESCLSLVKKHGINEPNILKIYKMDKRWGSYTPSGNILLNPELIKHPIYCVDYVIIHELCHIKHPNHDQDFYALLNKVLPDWQKRKHKLEGFS